jgi:hypothetical protein
MFAKSIKKPVGFKAFLVLALFSIWAQEDFSPAQESSFARTLYPVLEKAACRSCHSPDGVASATRLQFPEPGANTDQIEAFGRSLVALIDRKKPEESLLLKKPTNRVPHGGGERIKPGGEEEGILKGWVQRLAKMSDGDAASALKLREEKAAGAGTARPGAALRRLTHSQYNNSVRDLLGDQSAPANQFPPEDFVNGFKNQYQSQNLSPLLVEAYSAAAERLARNAFQGGDRRGLIPCKPTSACRARFVREFGLKAFRRPLDIGERRAKPKTLELEINTDGFVAGIPASKFSSPRELGAVLARSPQCQECLVKQYFRYTSGRMETPADRPLIQQVSENFRKSQFRFKELIISLVRSRELSDQYRER